MFTGPLLQKCKNQTVVVKNLQDRQKILLILLMIDIFQNGHIDNCLLGILQIGFVV